MSRVEDVTESAFTEVLSTKSGKYVRADFTLAESDEHARRLCWEQRVQESPFARLLKSAQTEVRLQDAAGGAATEVTIELRQTLNGFFSRFGAHMVRKAAARTIEEALDGLERIGG